jgi:exopolyphosphatase / guanosine-5'-triphosphate,3'-diphosphate pyrophosphatase
MIGEPTQQSPAPLVPSVTPRWEWREFADHFPPPFIPTAGVPAKEQKEIYLLSLRSVQNVKIREDRLEIKELERREGELELWRPTLKAPFPVDRAALLEAFRVWKVAPPATLPEQCDLLTLLDTILPAHPELRAVALTKRRFRFAEFECQGEWVLLGINGRPWQGIAFEDEDPVRLGAFLERMHLTPWRNESYPQALKRFLALPASVRAAT